MTATRAKARTKSKPRSKNRLKTRAKKGSKPAAAAKRGRSGRSRRPGSQERFEARRLAVERREGLKRLRLVLGLTAVTSVGVGVIAFLNSSWFDVDHIAITGNQRSDPDLIVEASGIELGQALMEVDLTTAAEEVQLVPWIGSAEITRSWSGNIEIAVVERGPSAVLKAGDRFALVDDHGRQLEIVETRPEGYMPVSGIEGSGVAGEAAPAAALPVIAILEALPAEIEAEVAGVAVEEDELFLELAAGGRVNFGDGTELGPKLQSLETMLAKVDLTCLNTIDVRVPAAPVLTRRQPPPADGASGDLTITESNDREEPDSTALDC